MDHDPTRGPARTEPFPPQPAAGRLPRLTVPTERVRAFAALLTDRDGADLEGWMSAVEANELPALHGFVRGLCKDLPAVVAGLSLPYSNGPAEGVSTKVKLPGLRERRPSGAQHLLRSAEGMSVDVAAQICAAVDLQQGATGREPHVFAS